MRFYGSGSACEQKGLFNRTESPKTKTRIPYDYSSLNNYKDLGLRTRAEWSLGRPYFESGPKAGQYHFSGVVSSEILAFWGLTVEKLRRKGEIWHM